MMNILIILLALLVISLYGICVLLKDMTDLNNHISELEKKIDNIQYQTDDVLCDINIVNRNVLNTYGLLSRKEDENENN